MNYFKWKKGENIQLSENFTSVEFECQCKYLICKTQIISKELVNYLQIVRHEYKEVVLVTSGYRCENHQIDLLQSQQFQTVRNSQHVLGNAADITGVNIDLLLNITSKYFNAIGLAKNFIHVDTRRDKQRRWNY